MGSKIKRFRVEAMIGNGPIDFESAEAQLLKQFDEWREKEQPRNLFSQFGRVDGPCLLESPHYCYLSVLYW